MSKYHSDKIKRLVEEVLITEVSAARKREIASFFETAGSEIPTNYGMKRDTDLELWGSRSDRTTDRYFHGFLFMQGWADYLRQSRSERAFKRAIEYARRWELLHPIASWETSGMAYHDETTAQRLITLLGLLVSARPLRCQFAERIADQTADLLESKVFHSGLNNHGMFQDLALRNYALAASWTSEERREVAWRTSTTRLKAYFLHAYTSEGVHVENTPTYHLMVSRHLQQHVQVLNAVDKAESAELQVLLENASSYATNVVLPNGQFPPISDTTIQTLESNAGRVFDEQFSYAVTSGRVGKKPQYTNVLFHESGYGIYRSDWDDPAATYVLFQAAYNDDYHKHSDDLSLILYGKNRLLITEGGPFGYNYSDPFTKYAYSQFAHNNIVVNGSSTPRTDLQASTVRIVAAEVDEKIFDVTASTGRLKGCQHQRRIKIGGRPRSEAIEVLDELVSDQNQNYSMYWHIPGDCEVILHGNGFEVYEETEKLYDAKIETDVPVSLSIKKGLTKPRIAGWSFPKFGSKEPLNTIVVSFRGEGVTKARTVFNLQDYAYVNRVNIKSLKWKRFEHGRGLNYLHEPANDNKTGTPLVFVFSAMGAAGDFNYNFKSFVDSTDCDAFYILDDFGDRGSYYLQEKKYNGVYETVQEFIRRQIASRPEPCPVYFCGIFKGATAALIHGLTIPESRIFVAAPHIKMGSLLKESHPSVLEYMTGGVSDEDVASLDRFLVDVFESSLLTESITIAAAKDDFYSEDVIRPLKELSKIKDVPFNIVILDGVSHTMLGKEYGSMLNKELSNAKQQVSLRNGVPPMGQISTWYDSVSKRLFASASPYEGTELAFRLYKGHSLIKNVGYSTENYFSWASLAPGTYRVRIFRRYPNEVDSSKLTGSWVKISESP